MIGCASIFRSSGTVERACKRESGVSRLTRTLVQLLPQEDLADLEKAILPLLHDLVVHDNMDTCLTQDCLASRASPHVVPKSHRYRQSEEHSNSISRTDILRAHAKVAFLVTKKGL